MIKAKVNVVEVPGKESLLDLTVKKSNLIAVVDSDVKVKPHQDIELVISLEKIHLFKIENGEAIP